MKQQRAFTLIELLVVIAIIAILAAILFPVFASVKLAAKNTVEITQARQIGMALKMYLMDNDDTMPIFYAYNSQPPAGETGHKGIEVLLYPYTKNKDIFRSPHDRGGPYTHLDVPGANSYWEAYGSSFRFTQCMYTIAKGESTQNNIPYEFSRKVTETQIQFSAESRAMRVEMFPFFSRDIDTDCSRYGYDCDPPYNYFRMWSPTGGSVIFIDGHAKFTTGPGQFDDQIVDAYGHRSGEPHPTSWSGTWYGVCD
ncbi:MAG: prepilin-type N-terminal cleavage/methylation domain-containing protein [Armatimonadetes bacterium]|nr:prepilin-type N-terminal cleavage/methylation domain-containing protein [Armatimonadota bacterium]